MDMNDVYEMLEYIIKFRTIRAVIKDRYPDLRVLRFENQEIIEDAELYILHEVAEDQERRILLNLDELLGEGGINPAYGELCEDWFRTRDKYMDICSELPFVRAILEQAWTEEIEYEYSGSFEVAGSAEAVEEVWACGDSIEAVANELGMEPVSVKLIVDEDEEEPFKIHVESSSDGVYICPVCTPEHCECNLCDSEECERCDCDECEVEEPPREPLLDPNAPVVDVKLYQDDEEEENGWDTEA